MAWGDNDVAVAESPDTAQGGWGAADEIVTGGWGQHDELVDAPGAPANKSPLVTIGKILDAGKSALEYVLPPGFIEQATTSPLPATHYQPDPNDSKLTAIAKGATNQATGLVEGVTSPAMLAAGAAGGVIPALAKPVAAAFLADTATHRSNV